MYWIAYKRRDTDTGRKRFYISGFDAYGNVLHSFDEKDAFHFTNFDFIMKYFDIGYIISREE